jgi:hypothetical protein
MRRLTLLLCLLMIAVLRWIIGFTEAPISTEQKDVVLFQRHVTLGAVNTGSQATPAAASTHTEDAAWITHKLLSAVIDARSHSTITILSRSTRRVEFQFTEIGAGTIEGLPPASDLA